MKACCADQAASLNDVGMPALATLRLLCNILCSYRPAAFLLNKPAASDYCPLKKFHQGSPIICAFMQAVLRHAIPVVLYLLTNDFVAYFLLQTIISCKLGSVRQL